jgi:long-chain acyl-CoA synthetase
MHPGEIARHTPQRTAIVCGSTRRDYAWLDSRSRNIAALLHHRGLRPGAVIALQLGNSEEFLAVAWAAQRSGLYYVPMSPRLQSSEAAYILADSGTAALFVDDAVRATYPEGEAGEVPTFFIGSEPIAGSECLDVALDAPEVSTAARCMAPLEGSDMLYTSGTTGRPKGVRRVLEDQPLGADWRRVERAQALFKMDENTVFLSPAPLYHAAPLRFAMNVLRIGGRVVLMPRFDAEQTLLLIEREGVTHSQWVPTMFTRLLELPVATRTRFELSSHRVAIHAGAPCAVALKHRMIDWWGPILHEYYSGTESIGFTHATCAEWLARPGTVGRPWRCDIHIVDEHGRECLAGVVGQVYFSGGAALNYHGDPAKTAAAHHPSGWATMGDLGYVDADGYLFLTDRKAFTIISGGVNIYPREVEERLLEHQAVADAAVFGVPDADLGEVVVAVVEPAAGCSPSLALARELYLHLREGLAGFKAPRHLDFVASLPRLDTGKIRKHDLRTRYLAAGERGYSVAQMKGG